MEESVLGEFEYWGEIRLVEERFRIALGVVSGTESIVLGEDFERFRIVFGVLSGKGTGSDSDSIGRIFQMISISE